MLKRTLVGAFLAAALSSTSSFAAITKDQIVVVYNASTTQDGYDWTVSKAVADYYCAARNIPIENQLGVVWPHSYEAIPPDQFLNQILNDQGSNPGLLTFLSSRPGFDIDNPGTDPTKCIVLCYGIPVLIHGDGRISSVDSALSILFNGWYDDTQTFHSGTPWGQDIIGYYCGDTRPNVGWFGFVQNPYYQLSQGPDQDPQVDPAERTIPADFGEFRRSTHNHSPEPAPAFTIVRFIDSTHALAAGKRGILYSGTVSEGDWTWTPVTDTDKRLIAHSITDICVRPDYVWVATPYAIICLDRDTGVWTRVASYSMSYTHTDPYRSVGFYSAGHGWTVGKRVLTVNRHYVDQYYIAPVPGNDAWPNDIPSSFKPRSVAVLDSTHVWISGDTGIWYTDDGGSNWGHVYDDGAVGDIWVGYDGQDLVGWAVALTGTDHGRILTTTDGSSWPRDLTANSPVISSGLEAYADLAVTDANHFTLACWTTAAWLYDNGTWSQDVWDSTGKCSVAWNGEDLLLGVDANSSEIRAHERHTVWEPSKIVEPMDWRLRYLVCRLDGISEPLESGIPKDIEAMIRRSVVSTDENHGRSVLGNSKFVVDDPRNDDSLYSSTFLNSLGRLADESNVVYDSGNTTYVTGDYVLPDQTHLSQHLTMGYTSNGSYHPNAHDSTTWWRPFLNWQEGSIGIFKPVSGDAHHLGIRKPRFLWSPRLDPGLAESGKLRVYLTRDEIGYSTHRVGLYKADGTLLTANGVPIIEPLTETETLHTVFDDPNAPNDVTDVRIVEIDLSTVDWPTGGCATYVALRFPENDPQFPDQAMDRIPASANMDIYNARVSGIAYGFPSGQSLDTELIHEGACGTVGNVIEPAPGFCPEPEIILAQYATGRTFAESAYMGLRSIGWLEIAIGDPLMDPYSVEPTASFLDPTPADGSTVSGWIPMCVSASESGNGFIDRVDFLVTDTTGKTTLLATDKYAPYECVWQALQLDDANRVYPDGDYTLKADVHQSGDVVGCTHLSREVTLDSTGAHSATITEPAAEYDIVDATHPIVATAALSPTSVDFYLLGGTQDAQASCSLSQAPYSCSPSRGIEDGPYVAQAVAHYAGMSFYSEPKGIILANSYSGFSQVSDLAVLDDLDEVSLTNVVTISGTTATMGSVIDPLHTGAFYIEDASRASGIRVETNQSIAMGRRIALYGILHKTGTGLTERYIEAYPGYISDFGLAESVPAPLGMSIRAIGGAAPTGTPGVTDAIGTYNTGLLVRTWGKVTFVGGDFFYIDHADGSKDGNVLEMPLSVPLNSDPLPTPPDPQQEPEEWAQFMDNYVYPDGVRVFCGDLDKPGIGDYVAVTGVSSTFALGERIARCIRLRTQDDVTPYFEWTKCAKQPPSPVPSNWQWEGSFVKKNPDGSLSGLDVGTPVRLSKAITESATSSTLTVRHWDVDISNQFTRLFFPIDIPANTQLPSIRRVTILGTTAANGGDQTIEPWQILLYGNDYGTGGMQSLSMMALGAHSWASEPAEPGDGPYQAWPSTDASDVLATERFRLADAAPGAIGWALSQPDGSVIDLLAERFVSAADGGATLGLAEWFEPFTGTPRLVLSLGNAITGLQPGVSTLDIRGGVLTTLPNGRRALVRPESVFVYVDEKGRPIPPFPFKLTGDVTWPWKTRIAP